MPDLNSLHSEDSLAKYASVALFVQRARASRSDFALTDENTSAVVEICEKLEGLPLAIELAAARVKILSPQDLLSRLDNQLKFLTGGAKDLPTRQQTMRNAISWSYDLLSETERKIFNYLSVFVGGCTLEAVEGVCAAVEDSGFDALEGVISLTDKSLLRQKEKASGSMRFRMLEVVREYGAEKLSESVEIEIIRKNHADYFLNLTETAEPELRGAHQAKWLDILEEEHGNLRAALEFYTANDIEKALRLAGAMHRLWQVHGHYTEGRNFLKIVLEKGADASLQARAKALIPAADLAWAQGDLASACRHYEECLQLSREIGDKRRIAQSCNGLGITQINLDNLEVRPLLEESLKIGRELADKAIIGVALMGLGELARLRGEYAEARSFYEEVIGEARSGGDSFNLLYGLFNLGSVACLDGDCEMARPLFSESLKIARDLGSTRAVADCLDGFASVSTFEENWEKAARLFGAADALRQSVGYEIPGSRPRFPRFFHQKNRNRTR